MGRRRVSPIVTVKGHELNISLSRDESGHLSPIHQCGCGDHIVKAEGTTTAYARKLHGRHLLEVRELNSKS